MRFFNPAVGAVLLLLAGPGEAHRSKSRHHHHRAHGAAHATKYHHPHHAVQTPAPHVVPDGAYGGYGTSGHNKHHRHSTNPKVAGHGGNSGGGGGGYGYGGGDDGGYLEPPGGTPTKAKHPKQTPHPTPVHQSAPKPTDHGGYAPPTHHQPTGVPGGTSSHGGPVTNVPSDCTVTTYDAVPGAIDRCKLLALSNIKVPGGKTLDLSKLQSGSTVVFKGTTTFGFALWRGPLLTIGGSGVTINFDPGAYLDGNGASYWDGGGYYGGKKKPKLVYLSGLNNAKISNLHIKNSPVHAITIYHAVNTVITGTIVDNSAGDGGRKRLARNTDGFDLTNCHGLEISNAQVHTQDDCIAVNSGSNIQFHDSICTQTHGMSVGSVGGNTYNDVTAVTFARSSCNGGLQCIRIKANPGTTGLVSNVLYSDITFSGMTQYGVIIQQDYNGGDGNGHPTKGVPITGVKLLRVQGSLASDKASPIKVTCAACSNWSFQDVSISGGSRCQCMGVPAGVSC